MMFMTEYDGILWYSAVPKRDEVSCPFRQARRQLRNGQRGQYRHSKGVYQWRRPTQEDLKHQALRGIQVIIRSLSSG